MHEEFQRALLSSRENQILELAIEGMTDIQIAQKLNISQSTVNSYWVRIRGKLGPRSRTELVALALKQSAKVELREALARIQELERIAADGKNAERYRAVLDELPEAVLITDEKGDIVYTNERLETMFRYGKGELVGRPVNMLVPARFRAGERTTLDAHLAAPSTLVIGTDKVICGLRSDGTEIPVALLLNSRETSSGRISICIARSFVEKADTRRRAWSASSPP